MGLFDTRKEHKSMKLVKKLQEQADLEWEREVERRKEQELNDEAIAKELQEQLQDERSRTPMPVTSSPPPPHISSSNSLPPPLPSKPRAYNSSTSLGLSANNNHSTNSLPTSQSFSSLLPKPLYAIQASSSQPALPPRQHDIPPSKKPVKSYLPSQTYQPELQFSVASPSPDSSSVFYQKTPITKPVVIVKPQSKPSSSYHNVTASTSDVDVPIHMNMPEPVAVTPPTTSKKDTIILQLQPRTSSTIPIVTPYPPTYQRKDSAPITLPLGTNDILQNASYPQKSYNNSSYNITPPATQNYNSTAPAQQNYNTTPPATQNYNNTPPTQQSYNSTPPEPQIYNKNPMASAPAQHSFNATTPAQQSYNSTPSEPQSYNSNPVASASTQHSFNATALVQQNFSSSAPAHQSFNTSGPAHQSFNLTAPPSRYNTPVQHSSYSTLPPSRYNTPVQHSSYSTSPPVQYPQHHSAPVIATTKNCASTSMPLNKQEQGPATNPYLNKKQSKPLFSNSVMTLKPDEEQPEEHEDDNDDWDILPAVTKRVHTPPPPPQTISDDESEYDYSDMIYDRRNEDEVDPFADPFADSFAIPNLVKTLEPTIQILDPTVLSRQLSTKIAVENVIEKEENVVPCEEIAKEEDVVRTYEEKESEEIESRSIQKPFLRTVDKTPIYQQPPFFNQTPEEEEVKVYPTNILRAGAPPRMSATNPYSKKQGAVPASDYGYYKENEKPKEKTLPKVPQTTSQEDRHITVASINPDQRVWIRIHPTDTGKMLAERIHIVASYQTRRVTKITTKNGRNIPLDNSPLFDDWNEIISFIEGEAWTVEWVPIESPYVDILTEGKEFMKFLKANFRGSSSNN